MLPALFELARDLPLADDTERFWKIFVERVSGLFVVNSLIYCESTSVTEPNAILGRARSGLGDLDLSDERLAKYFQTLQRPVQVQNMPVSFKKTRNILGKLDINWIASLADGQRSAGVVLLGLQPRIERDDQTDLVEELVEVAGACMAARIERLRATDLGFDLVKTLIGLYERHGPSSAERTELMASLIGSLARKLNVPGDQESDLRFGALLRDIGRLVSEGSIALQTEPLDENEQQLYQNHPEMGAELLGELGVSSTVADVVLCHHERFDGNGFPRGLQGREIPLAARLVAVAESYANLVTGDEESPLTTPAEAAKSLRGDDPGRLDPAIVETLCDLLAEAGEPIAVG
jgi:HD-GYP domain-containing protein (c-di-GMP phosphodiesterase class II)